MFLLSVALTINCVSPHRISTAPFACLARRPVRTVTVFPSISKLVTFASVDNSIVITFFSFFQMPMRAGALLSAACANSSLRESLVSLDRSPCSALPLHENRRATTRLSKLTSQTELIDESAITRWSLSVEVLQQTAAFAHHHQQSAAAMKIFLVGAKVLGELIDFLGEHRDLNFGRTCVLGVGSVRFDQFLF